MKITVGGIRQRTEDDERLGAGYTVLVSGGSSTGLVFQRL
jgi:hypothetical protein